MTDRICLLAPAATAWPGHIHTAYDRTPGGDREFPAVEKAAGKELATVGRASVEDVGVSGLSASVQPPSSSSDGAPSSASRSAPAGSATSPAPAFVLNGTWK